MGGSSSFFGGLLSGVSDGLLRRQMMEYESGMRDAESRRKAIDALLQSKTLFPEEVAPAIKALLAPTLMSSSIAGGFARGVGRAVTGRKKAAEQPDPMEKFWSMYESAPERGRLGVSHGPANAPLQTEQIGAQSGVPPTLPPIPERRKTVGELETERESQGKLREYQGQTDIRIRAEESAKNRAFEAKRQEFLAAGGKVGSPEYFNAMFGVDIKSTRPETLDNAAADLFSQYRTGKLTKPQFDEAVEALHQIKPPSEGAVTADIQKYNLAVSQGYKGGIQQWEKEQANLRPRDFGVTVIQPGAGGAGTVSRLKPGDVVPPGTVTPQQFGSTQVPTAATRTRSEFAEGLIPEVQTARKMVMDNRDLLGPTAGRFNARFLAGMVGSTGDPAADARLGALRARIGLLQTGMMVPHVGARGGQNLIKKFTDQVNEGTMTAEMLNAALGEWEIFLKRYAGEGRIRGWGGLSPNTTDEPISTKPVKTANDLKAKYGIK